MVSLDELKNMPIVPVLSVVGGVVVLIWPEVLSYAIGIYLIVTGGLELAKK